MDLNPFVLDRETFERYECAHRPRYPVSTQDAAAEIATRGVACDHSVLSALVRAGKVKPMKGKGDRYLWSAANVDTALAALCVPGYLLPLTVILQTLNLHAADFIRVWVEADEQLRSEYSSEVVGPDRVNPLDFDWHVESRRPARASIKMEPSKSLVGRLDAIIIAKEADVERTSA
jgi:hypothetical protein